MKKSISTLVIIALFSCIAFAQNSVKTEKAEIKPAVKAQSSDIQKAEKNTSNIQKKEVKAERVAKSSEKIEVQERKAIDRDAVIRKDATIKNPKINEDQKPVERRAVETNDRNAIERNNNSKSNPR